MNVLIVGGRSSLATVLKPVLSEFATVTTAGRKACDLKLDLTDDVEKMTLPQNLDVLIHTASHFGGDTAKDLFEAETVNVLGTLKLCQAAVKAKVKHFVYISSIFSRLPESSPQFSSYALSKRHAEEIANLYCSKHHMALTILRPSQIYGDEDIFRKHQPFFYTIVDKAQASASIQFYGSHDALRNYIHVNDVCTIISKVVQQQLKGTFSCAHPYDLHYSEIAKAAIAAFDGEGRISFLNEKDDILDNIFEKDNTLYEQINFSPAISIEAGMKRIANYRNSLL